MYIASAPTLTQGSPAARTIALAKILDCWRANANGVGCAFGGVIGSERWRTEWYNMYIAPNGALHMDGHAPLTSLEAPPATMPMPKSGLSSGRNMYVFLMERGM